MYRIYNFFTTLDNTHSNNYKILPLHLPTGSTYQYIYKPTTYIWIINRLQEYFTTFFSPLFCIGWLNEAILYTLLFLKWFLPIEVEYIFLVGLSEARDIVQFNERVWLSNDHSDSYTRKGNQSHIS